MRQQELENWLQASLSDFKLSQSEALELRDILPRLANDDIAYTRNKAFELAREFVHVGGDNAVATLLWLEKLSKVIDNFRQSETSSIAEAHFSPGEDCRRQLLDLLISARQSIDISVFTISDDRLANAILTAYQRKVHVRLITDNDKAQDQGSDIYYLINHGLPVRMDSTENHMHHKFAVIDKKILVNGSFNWTRSATDYNQENILVTDEPKLVSAYLEEFENLWQEFK
ncbi:phospholipase D-like domain-containing protein [Cellvibrio mixtus]|uniref:phospholipase D-like domain-containing protein n=1 Tax=Cellvibrio mixtus TaxID=39650 RepID=UPI000587788D|nr:phospholipase D-like domain-containing protein [Cellvibrio mixtus]